MQDDFKQRLEAALGEGKVSGSEIYRWLTTYYLHQDRISVERIQTFIAIEAGVLGGAFALRGLMAVITLALGSFLVWMVWRMVQRDWQIRDQSLHALDIVHKPLGLVIATPAPTKWHRASAIMPAVARSLIAVNCFCAALFLLDTFGCKWLTESLLGGRQ